jgi:hypothetical protein
MQAPQSGWCAPVLVKVRRLSCPELFHDWCSNNDVNFKAAERQLVCSDVIAYIVILAHVRASRPASADDGT